AEVVGLSPDRVAPGDPVIFQVRNASADVICSLDGIDLTVTSRVEHDGDAFLEAIVPALPVGAKPVATARNVGSDCTLASLDGALEIVAPQTPRITSLMPASGPDSGGTSVTLRGRGLRNAQVTICGEPLLATQVVQINDEFIITGATPPGCGVCDVSVQSVAGQDTLAEAFRYTSPEIVSFAPQSSLPEGGGVIEVRVTGGTNATQVFLGETRLDTVEPHQDGVILARIPPGAAGTTFDVSVGNSGSSCPRSTLPGEKFRYAVPVLFLGEFSFDLDDDDPVSGGSTLASLHESEGIVVETETGSRVTTIDLDWLRSFAAVFLSHVSARTLR